MGFLDENIGKSLKACIMRRRQILGKSLICIKFNNDSCKISRTLASFSQLDPTSAANIFPLRSVIVDLKIHKASLTAPNSSDCAEPFAM